MTDNGDQRSSFSFRDFAKSARANMRRTRVAQELPDEESPEASFLRHIQPWAQEERCTGGFIPWLELEIRKAEADTAALIGDHPRLTYAMGSEDTLKRLLSVFKSWAGQTGDGP